MPPGPTPAAWVSGRRNTGRWTGPWALTNAHYQYLRATREGDRLSVATWITRWDRRLTMERRFQIIDRDTGVTVLRAQHEFVCIEISTGKPRRPPPEFIARYGPVVLDLSEP